MHANRNYWSGLAPAVVTITNTTISDATLAAPADCTKATGVTPCLPATLAAYDLQTYAAALNGMLGEHEVSINAQSATTTVQSTSTAAGTFSPTYTLYVEP